MITCKNCGHQYEGNFCPNCGQRHIDKRFNLKDSVIWVFVSIFNMERGFVPTTLQLITRPGETIRKYLNGITIPYAHPFRFIFIWATISALLTVYFGFMEQAQEMMAQGYGEELNYSEQQMEFTRKSNEFVRNYFSLVTMAMIPFFSLFTYLFFRKKKYNYAEHLILNSYANASSIVIGIPLMALYPIINNIQLVGTISLIVSTLVISRIYALFFKVNAVIATIKYILAFVLTIVTITIGGGVFAIIYMIALKSLGMETPFDQVPETP